MRVKITIENMRKARDIAQGAIKEYKENNLELAFEMMLALHNYMIQIFREAPEETGEKLAPTELKTEPTGSKETNQAS